MCLDRRLARLWSWVKITFRLLLSFAAAVAACAMAMLTTVELCHSAASQPGGRGNGAPGHDRNGFVPYPAVIRSIPPI
jgi:hypothetical protein